MSLKDYLAHQLRWARTYRVCRPGGYLAYGITHALVYSLALFWPRAWRPRPWAWWRPPWPCGAPWPVFPSATASRATCPLKPLWLLPLKDFLVLRPLAAELPGEPGHLERPALPGHPGRQAGAGVVR